VIGHDPDSGFKLFEFPQFFVGTVDDGFGNHVVTFEGIQEFGDFTRLVIEVESDFAFADGKSFVEGGDDFVGMLFGGLAIELQCADFIEGELIDFPLAVGRPIDGAIVHENEFSVFGFADIEFDVIAAEINGGADRGKRVFGGIFMRSAMCSDEDALTNRIGCVRLGHGEKSRCDERELEQRFHGVVILVRREGIRSEFIQDITQEEARGLKDTG